MAISVTDEKNALAQVVEKLHGNVLLAVFSGLLDADEVCDVNSFAFDDPIFLMETMDLRIKDGVWRILGHREVSGDIPIPEYKVWVEPPGEYRIQDIHGNIGDSLTSERAEKMRLQKSFSPAVVETALRGFHGMGPWRPFFDELTL
ncbi:hypothetical protein [Streptomyces gilvus]|uniref:hypothetical protein n=1 Tax=Streptomyces gilvus TaxID=2920937 RepID=UPI001F0FDAD6|nr:hypothetical protein [Streptomyces sp. CME 23]MCH5674932.1 hypothetical protein [Streptomyces sp. CME 23]